jgi:hypothetical protein
MPCVAAWLAAKASYVFDRPVLGIKDEHIFFHLTGDMRAVLLASAVAQS